MEFTAERPKLLREKRMRADRVSWIVTTVNSGKLYGMEFHCQVYADKTLAKLRGIVGRHITRFDGLGGECEGMAAGVERHWPTPSYTDHKPVGYTCTVLGGECYTDGSSLAASEFAESFGNDLCGQDESIFRMVECRLRSALEDSDHG